MRQVEVTILGQSYLLACPDDGEVALLAAVQAVDREMSAIRDAGKVKARERIAVLAALNLAYRLAGVRDDVATSATVLQPGTVAGADAGAGGLGDAALLQQFVSRIDAALADDGRLL